MARYRLGLDIGGTFTDFVLVDQETGRAYLHKHLTSYPDPAPGVMAGLRELLALAAVGARELATIVHSTTLVTNAIIDRRGARAGLITTAGFVHILDLGKEQRYDTYNLFLDYPDPLIPPALRREVAERTLSDGAILTLVDEGAALAAASELVAAGAEALAIVFLHAYCNPANEQAAAAAIRRRFPDLPLSLSSTVAPLMGEWERTSTTAADAYVRPIVERYLARLQAELAAEGFGGRFGEDAYGRFGEDAYGRFGEDAYGRFGEDAHGRFGEDAHGRFGEDAHGRFVLMFSDGGVVAQQTARAFPIRLLESGPAAGVRAAVDAGRRVGLRDLLAFDMGGTTAKACLVIDGAPHMGDSMEAARTSRFRRGSGLPIRVPSVALIEVGAGGGSIAWRNDLGLLQVGPQSAAADPGPACYGLGGQAPTVTDADLLLGYLNPDFFLGGRMRLEVSHSQAAVGELAGSLGLDMLSCARGICAVIDENMAAAARMHIVERGHDPRRFAVVASGGAGPAHVSAVARLLGGRRFVIPAGAGALSSWGCLAAPLAFSLDRTRMAPLSSADWPAMADLLRELTDEAVTYLARAGAEPAGVDIEVAADMRMIGQVHPIRVPLTLDEVAASAGEAIAARFHTLYEQLFVRTNRHMPLEFVNWHVTGRSYPPPVAVVEVPGSPNSSSAPAAKGTRPAWFAGPGFVETPVYDHYRLQAGMAIDGPAIVEERESTAVLQPGDRAEVDRFGNLLVEIDS